MLWVALIRSLAITTAAGLSFSLRLSYFAAAAADLRYAEEYSNISRLCLMKKREAFLAESHKEVCGQAGFVPYKYPLAAI